MPENEPELVRTTRPLRPELVRTLQRLKPGQRIRITQTVRVGSRSWQAVIEGAFREVRSLVTGLATERHPADQIIVPTVHFTKPNGELSSVSLDQNTVIDLLPAETT